MTAARIDRGDNGPSGFLSRLLRDRRGNTMAIMAASLIPLVGMVGGGFDLSRLYLVKTRLQHACDAGALAGRKAMGGGVWAQTVNGVANYPNASAVRFFDANFDGTPYGVATQTRSFTESAGKVTGAASATVPMTLMRVMGFDSKDLSVTCDAEMRLPNTDVMFVLDNTGSMGETLPGDTRTKIVALRSAVRCFYEVVARLDTRDPCSGGAPSGGTGDQVQVRFGFVPYDMNVNVGRLLPTEYFADRWRYQSRERALAYGTIAAYTNGTTSDGTYTTSQTSTGVLSAALCAAMVPGDTAPESTTAPGTPTNESDLGWQATQGFAYKNYRGTYTSGTKTCVIQVRTQSYTRTNTYIRVAAGTTGAVAFNTWHYGYVPMNVSGLKASSGVNWNGRTTLPIGNGFTDATVTWDGCVEERATVRQTSYSPIPAGARDMDIDGIPSASDPDSLWGPVLQQAIFTRKIGYNNNGNSRSQPDRTTFYEGYTGGFNYDCPAPAHKMEIWDNPNTFDNYVDTMVPGGNTYHDIGLVWGARLMSPTGLFASENAYTPRGGEIERHLIFMTDGDACTDVDNYQAYGLAWYDRRQTDPTVVPTDGCTTTGTLTQQVNARSAALCTAIKNKNITLWVIWFGASNTTIENQLRTCATSSRFIAARNSTQLQAAFRSIADEISSLRLTG